MNCCVLEWNHECLKECRDSSIKKTIVINEIYPKERKGSKTGLFNWVSILLVGLWVVLVMSIVIMSDGQSAPVRTDDFIEKLVW